MELESKSLDSAAGVYSLLEALTPDRTFLCTDVSSNILVLKTLDEDCLHQRQLHPSIKERLAHVRDMPHPRLATLRGVERWNNKPCLIWSWLDGENWTECTAVPIEDFPALASALADAVDALHELGIVHGSLHGGNVIVRPGRQVWLTDISPYLYTDFSGDIEAVVTLIEKSILKLPDALADWLGQSLDEVKAGRAGLRELSHALRSMAEQGVDVPAPEPVKAKSHRKASVLAALAIAVLGVGTWLGIHWFVMNQRLPTPTTFPSLKAESRQ